jgi:hypothetical protein
MKEEKEYRKKNERKKGNGDKEKGRVKGRNESQKERKTRRKRSKRRRHPLIKLQRYDICPNHSCREISSASRGRREAVVLVLSVGAQ